VRRDTRGSRGPNRVLPGWADPFKAEVAARLHELRTERGLTRRELAERAGVSVGAVRLWERGEAAPQGASVALLATALSMSVEDLRARLTSAPTVPTRLP
jgi:transcriptional regulator with XRE-family HTH domain